MKIAIIQMNSVSDVAANIAKARSADRALRRAGGPGLGVPARALELGGRLDARTRSRTATTIPAGRPTRPHRSWRRRHKIWVHAGSMLERAEGAADKVHNTTVVFDRTGREVAVYRKIHLFDITLPDGTRVQARAPA